MKTTELMLGKRALPLFSNMFIMVFSPLSRWIMLVIEGFGTFWGELHHTEGSRSSGTMSKDKGACAIGGVGALVVRACASVGRA